MSTFVKLGLDALDARFKEIDLILNTAEINLDSNQDLYDALCRSAQVLLIAHFEGYIKDLVRNVLEDINYNSTFKSSRQDLKFTFCANFIPPNHEGKINHSKIKELIQLFDSLDTKFNKEYFLYADNKNPKASVISTITKRFGIDDFFDKISRSNLDLIFSNTNSENLQLNSYIKERVKVAVESYPFACQIDLLEPQKDKNKQSNLWLTFLDKILNSRHEIVHGNEVKNSLFYGSIKEDRMKLEILLYALTIMLCERCNPIE